MTLERRITQTESSALEALDGLIDRANNAKRAIQDGQRVFAGVSGDPDLVAKALDADAAIRARQLLYDVQKEEA